MFNLCKSLLLFAVTIIPQQQLSGQQSSASDTRRANMGELRVDGAGSTTVYPLLSAWIGEFNYLHPQTQIKYRAIGSTAGTYEFTNRRVLFAATDIPLSDDQLKKIDGRILQLPVALNAVVPAYNLAHVPELHLSGSSLADIFLGKITKWNDPAIAAENPGIGLPVLDIKVIHSFPNGNRETSVMADYLAKISPAFKAALDSSSGDWPLKSKSYQGALGAQGFIHDTPGAIGYVWQNRVYGSEQYALVKNIQGEYVAASPESLAAAAAGAVPVIRAEATDFRMSITNSAVAKSYPISSFTWLLLRVDSKATAEYGALIDFINWVLADGQKIAVKRGYPALSGDLVKSELQRVNLDTQNQ